MTSEYGKEYFQSANYSDYMERSDRYYRQAAEIEHLLRQLCLLNPLSVVVDYGCAVGFIVEWFIKSGYKNTVGIDASEWARGEARKRGLNIIPSVDHVSRRSDVMLAFDVFEHMSDDAIADVIDHLQPRAIIARIPCSVDNGKTFYLSSSRMDATHINCKTKSQWEDVFTAYGYTIMHLDLYTVYDTIGVDCLLAVKRNATKWCERKALQEHA